MYGVYYNFLLVHKYYYIKIFIHTCTVQKLMVQKFFEIFLATEITQITVSFLLSVLIFCIISCMQSLVS